MFERASGGPPVELPPPGPTSATGPITDLTDPRALQIMFTEHWSLLANRSLVYNEAFTRASIFVTAVTGSVLALGFVAQAEGFDDEFGWFAVLVLMLDLILGIGTLARLRTLTLDDYRHVQGMNRMRHGYFEAAPWIARYFLTSGYDDTAGVLQSYGGLPTGGRIVKNAIQGLTTVTALVGVVVALLVAGVIGMLLVQLDLGSEVGFTAGFVAFVVTLGAIGVVGKRLVSTFARELDATATFPTPSDPREG